MEDGIHEFVTETSLAINVFGNRPNSILLTLPELINAWYGDGFDERATESSSYNLFFGSNLSLKSDFSHIFSERPFTMNEKGF